MSDGLLDRLKTGICPFTGRRYDCARCETKPERRPIPGGAPGVYLGVYELHLAFCITRFATGQTTAQELKRIARGFAAEDGAAPEPNELLAYFRELYRLGVEKIPMCQCKRFCFRHGCMGDGE